MQYTFAEPDGYYPCHLPGAITTERRAEILQQAATWYGATILPHAEVTMARANKVCSCTGRCGAHPGSCPEIVPAGTSRCPRCDTCADRARGTAAQRGYNSAGHRSVLTRNPLCTCTDQTRTATHHHGPVCGTPSSVADHHPRSRKDLIALGLNPNDAAYGRGVCKGCHDHSTSQAQPGGWNQRDR
jgi:5-methylcytosine-specific restriction protein A